MVKCVVNLSRLKTFDTYHKNDYKLDKGKKIVTLGAARSHNEPLNKKLEERLIDTQVENTNLTKHL